jgi:D-glycero-alpha-D-manno-heptose 1-phosphate guanylyltransferase
MKRSNRIQITPIILAGGKGTRLQKVVSDRSKVMAQVKGRPFICYVMDQLIEAGFEKVILCVGYLAETLSDALGCQYRNMSIVYSKENFPLGTGGAARNAVNLLDTSYLLVMNGDSFIKVDLGGFVDWHFNKGLGASIILAEVPDVSRYGSVIVDDNQTVTEFSEKTGVKRPGLVNAGIYLFEKGFLEDAVDSGNPYSLEKEFFPVLAGKITVGGYACVSSLLDIGTPESYRMAEASDAL